MLLSSGRHIQSAVCSTYRSANQSTKPLYQASVTPNRSNAGNGHLVCRHRSSVLWSCSPHLIKTVSRASHREGSHADAASSGTADMQPSDGAAEDDGPSTSIESQLSRGVAASGNGGASTSGASPAAQSAHERIRELYPILGAALDTKEAVGASRDNPAAVLQACGGHARELLGITLSSLAWTGDALTQLITKPIVPRSAHIAQLRKAVQADPSNADK